MSANEKLVDALKLLERECAEALDGVIDWIEPRAESAGDDEANDRRVRKLRDALEMVRCLRRIVADCTPQQIHRAFGAPGDFGYETPIGDALASVYGVWS